MRVPEWRALPRRTLLHEYSDSIIKTHRHKYSRYVFFPVGTHSGKNGQAACCILS